MFLEKEGHSVYLQKQMFLTAFWMLWYKVKREFLKDRRRRRKKERRGS
jgi:hypothetical protein